MTWGVDYGSVDGNRPPDLKALKGAGASFVWVRGSYAFHVPVHDHWVVQGDPTFARDWEPVRKAGFIRGTYMFPVLQATQSFVEQVAVFKQSVDAAGGLQKGIDFPPCLDVEFPQGIAGTGLDRAGVLAWIRGAALEIKKQFGCWPILYTSGRVWNDTDADCLADPPAPDLVNCPLWLARYAMKARLQAILPPLEGNDPPVPHPWGDEWHAHQDQGDALGVPGFSSTVDVDRFRVARQGDKGGHIAWMQRKFGIKDDGVFGPQTTQYVVQFQRIHGLIADGIVGPQTFCALAWLP